MRSYAFHPLQIPLGFVLWAVWFVALYGGLSVACEVEAPPPRLGAANPINFGLGAMTLATAALLAVFARGCWRASRRAGVRPAHARFVARLAAAVHLAAFVATLFIGVPLLRLPPCV